MKIAESSIQMAASHASVSKREVQESLRMWVGDRRPDFEARRSEGHREARHGGEGLRVSLSDRARMARIEPPTPEPAKDSEQDEILDSAMSMLRALTEMFTGRPVKIFDPRELEPGHRHGRGRGESTGTEQAAAPQRAGFGIEYDRVERVLEEESSQFSAQGRVTTADGREIEFKLEISLYRRFESETRESLRAGDAVMQDPLVLNFSRGSAALSPDRIAFDIDADGQTEEIARLKAGSGFLALDLNGNGSIDDGSELFGPKSGNGFAELAAHDEDGNGWIDESDSVFERLSVWRPGESTTSLKSAGVGALYLGSVATPFALRDGANESLGALRSSGMYLNENGSAGVLQQIDLAV